MFHGFPKMNKGCMMKTLKITGLFALSLFFYSFAGLKDETKTTYHSFSIGPAYTIGNTEAPTIPVTNLKKLHNGWDADWTFFGKPFLGTGLSGLAFGGKISYSRWVRDSTFTPVTFLGVQGILRYYMPRFINPLNFFGQVGGGWFTGEYGFTDPDTVVWDPTDFQPRVKKGQNCFGVHFGVGVNADVVEIMPVFTIVATQKLSAWLSLNVGMTF
jgi:hypothetical protein